MNQPWKRWHRFPAACIAAWCTTIRSSGSFIPMPLPLRISAASRSHPAPCSARERRRRQLMIKLAGKKELLEGSKAVRQTVDLRNPATAPLSKLQVALLEEWDKMDETERLSNPAWRDAVLLSITGIAAAMQSTG